MSFRRLPQPVAADIVSPALRQRRTERYIEQVLQDRNVTLQQLFLKRNRVRGNDNGLACSLRQINRRDQVGKAFTDTSRGTVKAIIEIA